MTVSGWIVVGICGFFVVSLLVGLAVAAILNSGGRQLSDLIELEAWTSAPLTQTKDQAAQPVSEHFAPGRAGSSTIE